MKNYLSKKAQEITPYTAGEQPSDKKYVKLNTNENPYPPSPKALQAYREYDFGSLKLYPPLRMDGLRAAVAEAEGVEPENVFCGNGSDEILAFCFPAFFDSDGKGAAFADITYSFYPVFCDFFNIPKRILPLEEDFTLDLAKLTKMQAQGVIVANPNAPTGIGIGLSDMEKFIAENDRIVIVDEAYMPFFNESAVSLTKKYKNLLVVKTFSKGYSLAGLRCGYAIGDASLISGLERCRDSFNSYPVDALCQAVCAAAISDGEYYRQTAKKVIEERARVREELVKLGFFVPESASNFLFAGRKDIGGEAVYKGLKERGVLVRFWNTEKLKDFCRITVGTREENDRLLAALKELLSAFCVL